MMKIIEAIRDRQSGLAAIRRDIHAHPETAFAELRTAEVIARHLERSGIEVHRGMAKTGVIGVLRAGSGRRAVGLRADMDALPIQERNSFEHCSRNAGRMHACGHDGHSAMLLGAAEYLAATRQFDGTVVFIFQPAEEGEAGGRVMVEEGLFERFPVESVYGMHNWPGLEVGKFAVMAGPMMAGADEFEITVSGQGAHAAMPHQGVDPVLAGSALVQALQSVVSRNVHPVDSAVLSVTQFHAGDAYNVIPEQALLRGTVRAFKSEVQELCEAAMRRVCDGIAASFGARIALDYERGYPPTINSAAEAEVCREVAASLVGADNVRGDMLPSMGAEDFSFMLMVKPGCYVWIGNGGAENPGGSNCMLHNPHYDFNDEIIALGATYWVRLVERVLSDA
jgi:hippurate hydrolase